MQELNKKPKILLIDDEANYSANVKFELSREEFSLFHAQNGIEAMEVLATNNIDLIITDTALHEMDGVFLLSYIIKHWSKIPVIVFFSGIEERPEVDEKFLKKMGAKHILTKSGSYKDLVNLIHRLLDRVPVGAIFEYEED